MKPTTLVTVLTAAVLASGAAHAGTVTYHFECKSTASGKCPPPPAPPTPPTPPTPPAPPAPDGSGIPPVPPVPPVPAVDIPAPPVPPAPPAPPKLPDIPAGAHAACAKAAAGTSVTWVLRPGATMRGVCEKDGGKMVFALRSYTETD